MIKSSKIPSFTVLASAVLVAFVIFSLLIPLFISSSEIDLKELGPSGPSTSHWLGTDQLGRDSVASLAQNMQIGFKVAAIVVVVWGIPCLLFAVGIGSLRNKTSSRLVHRLSLWILIGLNLGLLGVLWIDFMHQTSGLFEQEGAAENFGFKRQLTYWALISPPVVGVVGSGMASSCWALNKWTGRESLNRTNLKAVAGWLLLMALASWCAEPLFSFLGVLQTAPQSSLGTVVGWIDGSPKLFDILATAAWVVLVMLAAFVAGSLLSSIHNGTSQVSRSWILEPKIPFICALVGWVPFAFFPLFDMFPKLVINGEEWLVQFGMPLVVVVALIGVATDRRVRRPQSRARIWALGLSAIVASQYPMTKLLDILGLVSAK